MQAEEIRDLFDLPDDSPWLGPIEDIVAALGGAEELPRLAIGVCALRADEAAPLLIGVVEAAAAGKAMTRVEEEILVLGLYLLGGGRRQEACGAVCRLLEQCSAQELDRVLADVITQDLQRILAGVFDGDAQRFFRLATDLRLDQYVRASLIDAVTFLTWDGRITLDRTREFLKRFYVLQQAPAEDCAWVAWLTAVSTLGLRDLVPLVEQAWHDGLVMPGVIELAHFRGDLSDAEHRPRDPGRLERANIGYIEDVLDTLSWMSWGQSETRDWDAEPLWEPSARFVPQEPVINPWRHVGRNDPCPCGSGKKAKKCCLAQG